MSTTPSNPVQSIQPITASPRIACIDKRCYSPMACNGFGYCRERNHDGTAMTEEKVRSLRKQEEFRAALEPEKPL